MSEQKRKHNNKGFSLVELIIVIAIITILAVAIGINVLRYIEKARIAKDVHHGSLIKDALTVYPFPSNYQGEDVWYTDPETGVQEHYRRGWVYVDKDEIRCSDPSTALAMIRGGLVYVSAETEYNIAECEENGTLWFPSAPEGDFTRRSGIDEYVFKREGFVVQAKTTWNTYQLDVYVDDAGELHLGASASNDIRVGGHAKDAKAAKLFAQKLGFDNAFITPIGEQYNGD